MLHREANAKINLSLEVVGRRPDGFHELISVMQTVSLADSVTVSDAERISVMLSGRPIDAGTNLVETAAKLLFQTNDLARGCRIDLRKEIPVAAGLGGGSSDAAAALLALLELWDLSIDCSRLVEIAAEIGSDVPFFLWGGTALVEGRGERVIPLRPLQPTWYLLVNPGFAVSTAAVFAELDPSEWTDGSHTRELARKQGAAPASGVNGLKAALFRVAPEARDCYDAFSAVAPSGAQVSGSGPTMFALYPSRQGAERARAAMSGYETHVVTATPAATGSSPCTG